MKQYNFGINTFYRTANINIEEGPWYLFAIERLGELAFFPFKFLQYNLSDKMFSLLVDNIQQWTDKYKTHTTVPIDYNDLIDNFPEYKKFHDEAMAKDPPHIFEKMIEEEKLPEDQYGYDGGWILRDPTFGIEVRGTNCNISRKELKEKVLKHINRI